MGSINFNNLKSAESSRKNHTYADISLDFGKSPLGISLPDNEKSIYVFRDGGGAQVNFKKNSIVKLYSSH